ncbi:MAG TPA: 2-oxoglutarate dehydrogenase complex dihydrolipoyllysine-residue succinyltransferase [Chloroflexota bacterium]|nr:2-oxoglutarate dehydrogenase complex dihydrolipoyllysine-residue succinyltransferase [Chloroflexota bacterium]
MATEVRVPVFGESVVEATVGRWLKAEGEPVAVGEPIVELETEKVSSEVAADESGVLERVLRQEGETVRPGDVLALIGEPAAAPAGGDGSASHLAASDGGGAGRLAGARAPDASAPPPPAAPPASASAVSPAPAAPAPEAERVRASPLAQRLASELGVDLARVPGSGPGGRVTRDDVQAAGAQASARPAPPPPPAAAAGGPAAASAPPAAAPPAPAAATPPGARPETRERLSRRRQAIARRLVEAQQTAAMLTTFNEVDLTAVMALRAKWRDGFRQQYGVSLGYMSFFTRAVVGALKAFPRLNAELQGDELVLKHYYDIGIAVGDPEGLVVPVLRDADRLTFAQIEQAIAGFAQRARERTLTLEDLRGGTFTITNGGVFGSLLSTPILNPPQVGILGMHKIQERPAVVDGAVVVRPLMYLALTYDHRVVDGREAVQFLVRVKDLLEAPDRLLLEA